MLVLGTTTEYPDVEAVRRALRRVDPSLVADVFGTDVIVTGSVPDRVDEYGGPAAVDETDRQRVLDVLTAQSSENTDAARAKTLSEKSSLTATETAEALKLLLRNFGKGPR